MTSGTSWRLTVASLLLFVAPGAGAYVSPQLQAYNRLRAASAQPVHVLYEQGYPSSVSMAVPVSGADPVEQAGDFLSTYGDFYLIGLPGVELIHARTDVDEMSGGAVVRFAQKYRGFPVFGAELTVHIAPSPTGAPSVVETGGALLVPALVDRDPPVAVDPDLVPSIPVDEAEELARAALGRPGAPVRGESIPMIWAPSVFDEAGPSALDPAQPPPLFLVYRVSLGTADDSDQALIDANTGELLSAQGLQSDSSGFADYDMEMKDDATGGQLIGNEGGLVASYLSNTQASVLWWAARDVYAFYHDTYGRHSYDGGGARVDLFINHVFSSGPNAAAKNGDIKFSTGWVAPDIYAHEYTHLITDDTSGLQYKNQSGALNEAFSDIMAATFDDDDWLLGEGTTGNVFAAGAARSLQNPPLYNCFGSTPCPDHMSNYLSLSPPDQPNDYGGVHHNSSIINKAFYLMADGGIYPQIYINGIGRWKMGVLAYNTFRFLPSNATFSQASWAFINKAAQWVNSPVGFTYVDRCDVHNSLAAVGIRWPDFDCDGGEDGVTDTDGDWIFDDGDGSGTPGDDPCHSFQGFRCDDNCPTIANPDQVDSDWDGDGDACDSDVDGDGYPNWVDTCPGVPNDFTDWDTDGIPSCLDPDDDGDSVPDDGDGDGNPLSHPCLSFQNQGCDDNCQIDPNTNQYDGNSNGFGDACDPDTDGDGFYVDTDNCNLVYNPSQADADGDGLGDACDKCPGVPDNANAYTTGIPELGIPPVPLQPDSDQDGIPDACDGFAWYQAAARLNGSNYSAFNAIRRDALPRTLEFAGDPFPGQEVRLVLPACDGGAPAAGERYELVVTGLPAAVEAWVENGDGRIVGRARPSASDPSASGLRFRPRCDNDYRLFLRTIADWSGSATMTVTASLVDELAENPWISPPDPGQQPPPIPPDADGDGLLDTVDLCPANWEPTNAETDGDGIGDACDNCPTVFNPGQLPVAFETIVSDGQSFSWTNEVDYDWAWGPLTGVSAFTTWQTGSYPRANTHGLVGGTPSAWYLFKLTDCGTWGSAARDAVLP